MKNSLISNPSQELVKLLSFKEWRQRITLDETLYTPGTRSSSEWDSCWLPENLQGKSFLDVGANDGMFSFLAEERGAEVMAIDLYKQDGDESYHMTEGWPISRIELIKKHKNSKIKVESVSIYDLEGRSPKYDYVFCGNVLAWLKSPFLALENLAACTGQTLIIREDISKIGGPPLLEYKNNFDFTNCFFNGNESYYTSVLRSLGFKSIEFKDVNEFEIMEKRNREFPKFVLKKGLDVYLNLFLVYK